MNPDLSAEEAEEQYLANVKKNQELGVASFKTEGDDDAGKDDDDDV